MYLRTSHVVIAACDGYEHVAALVQHDNLLETSPLDDRKRFSSLSSLVQAAVLDRQAALFRKR